jgi:integrase
MSMKKTRHAGVYLLPDGRYLIRYTATCPETHKLTWRKYKLPLGTTLGQAAEERARRQATLRGDGPPAPPSSPALQRETLRDYSVSWLSSRSAALNLKPSVQRTYAVALAHHILPHLGDIYLDSLTRQDILAWIAWTRAAARRCDACAPSEDGGCASARCGQPYSLASRRQWWRVLRVLLKDAHADGLTGADLTYRVPAPNGAADAGARREKKTLTQEQLRALLEALREVRPERFVEVITLASTGLRSGELWGLRWPDLDLTQGMVHVRASAWRRDIIGATKTGDPREVPLPRWLCALLAQHRGAQAAKAHPGLARQLVFPSQEGTFRTAGSLRKTLARAAAAAGIQQRVGPQVLRRTFNTLMVQAGVDRIILRSIMGHTTEEMTARYAGVALDTKKEAQEALDLSGVVVGG